MRIPQILVIVILASSLGISLGTVVVSDGRKSGDFIGQCVMTAIWVALLTWGGFWK